MSIALLSNAQTTSEAMYMVLTLENGYHKAINIAEVSRLTFPGGVMNVENKDSSVEQIEISEIDNMEFSNNETGDVENIVGSYSSLAYDSTNFKIVFDGIAGSELCVYDANGILILHYTITNNGSQTLDLSVLSNGIYIATLNNQSIKIVK